MPPSPGRDSALDTMVPNQQPVSELTHDTQPTPTFRHGDQGQNVADLELGLLAGIHELSSVQTLDSDEGFSDCLVSRRQNWMIESKVRYGDTCRGV